MTRKESRVLLLKLKKSTVLFKKEEKVLEIEKKLEELQEKMLPVNIEKLVNVLIWNEKTGKHENPDEIKFRNISKVLSDYSNRIKSKDKYGNRLWEYYYKGTFQDEKGIKYPIRKRFDIQSNFKNPENEIVIKFINNGMFQVRYVKIFDIEKYKKELTESRK